jgi:hypothetical protein
MINCGYAPYNGHCLTADFTETTGDDNHKTRGNCYYSVSLCSSSSWHQQLLSPAVSVKSVVRS